MTSDAVTELKPCPFCGATADREHVVRNTGLVVHREGAYYGLAPASARVICFRCLTWGPRSTGDNARQLAIEAWNKRTP